MERDRQVSENQASFMGSFPFPAGASSMTPALPVVRYSYTPSGVPLCIPFQAPNLHGAQPSLKSSFEFLKTKTRGDCPGRGTL